MIAITLPNIKIKLVLFFIVAMALSLSDGIFFVRTGHEEPGSEKFFARAFARSVSGGSRPTQSAFVSSASALIDVGVHSGKYVENSVIDFL